MIILNDAVMVDEDGLVIVSSLKHYYPKLYQRILSLICINGVDESYIEHNNCTCNGLFKFSMTKEGPDFWWNVNRYELWQYAQQQQPHLFEQGLTSDVVTLNDIKF